MGTYLLVGTYRAQSVVGKPRPSHPQGRPEPGHARAHAGALAVAAALLPLVFPTGALGASAGPSGLSQAQAGLQLAQHAAGQALARTAPPQPRTFAPATVAALTPSGGAGLLPAAVPRTSPVMPPRPHTPRLRGVAHQPLPQRSSAARPQSKWQAPQSRPHRRRAPRAETVGAGRRSAVFAAPPTAMTPLAPGFETQLRRLGHVGLAVSATGELPWPLDSRLAVGALVSQPVLQDRFWTDTRGRVGRQHVIAKSAVGVLGRPWPRAGPRVTHSIGPPAQSGQASSAQAAPGAPYKRLNRPHLARQRHSGSVGASEAVGTVPPLSVPLPAGGGAGGAASGGVGAGAAALGFLAVAAACLLHGLLPGRLALELFPWTSTLLPSRLERPG